MFLLVALFAYFSAAYPDTFLTSTNIMNMLTAVSVLWVLAMGMTFVLLTGGADLSVGAIAAIAGILLAKLLGAGLPGGLALILTVVVCGILGGMINGVLIGRLRLSFFLVTLASMTALTGVVYLWTDTQALVVTAPVATQIAIDKIAGVQTPIWIMLATLLVAMYVQARTYFGRDVYAVGGSLTAARLAGIRTSATLVAVYGVSGACAGLAGAIAVGRIGSATPTVDHAVALDAIAAVLLGGTSLFGGTGGVGGTALGVLFIGVLLNGLSIAGVASHWQGVVTGVILVAAVLLGERGIAGGGLGRTWRRLTRHPPNASS